MHAMQVGDQVGRVIGLWRYPVKSMAGEAMSACDASWHGVTGDRRWAFVKPNAVQSGFPWLTLRERPDMHHYRSSFLDPTNPDKSATVVRTPSGAEFDVSDPAIAMELGAACVIRQNRGIFDTFPLSLITIETIAQLGEWIGTSLGVARFRPNILVKARSGRPFAEDDWVGRVLHIGSARLRIDKRDGRCAVITIDPVTTERNPEVLRRVVHERGGYLGVYATTCDPGRMDLDDAVILAAPASLEPKPTAAGQAVPSMEE
jgi:uncharacterized protein YcbX